MNPMHNNKEGGEELFGVLMDKIIRKPSIRHGCAMLIKMVGISWGGGEMWCHCFCWSDKECFCVGIGGDLIRYFPRCWGGGFIKLS